MTEHKTKVFDIDLKWHECQSCRLIGTKKHLNNWECERGRYHFTVNDPRIDKVA